ncbi:hypothetical protein B0T16DRAFT_489317 [Cercophora newfieldiana]|uniref:Uncharacterized protein n=1 Tax=Cercophora newfieldiana TaxID=92897 RepID=A0AA39YF93_9PEZI|nr:hypothetical protein B0T16DRAFT_489317 [Cercophora newfieldiana]
MERLQSTTTRLRRTFTYDSDSDDPSPSTPSIMDEDEQDHFIQSLTLQNQSRNRQFRQLLLAMPLISSFPYLLSLFHPHTFLLSFLALSSLASTSYLLLRLPLTKTGLQPLDDIPFGWGGLVLLFTRKRLPRKPERRLTLEEANRVYRRRHRESDASSTDEDTRRAERAASAERARVRVGLPLEGDMDVSGPLLEYLPYLNVGLSVVVAVAGFLNYYRFSEGEDEAMFLGFARLGNLPLLINVVVIVAKMIMAGVDPERELSELRYEYKGA